MYFKFAVLYVQISYMHSRAENRLFNAFFPEKNKSGGKKPQPYSEINKAPNKWEDENIILPLEFLVGSVPRCLYLFFWRDPYWVGENALTFKHFVSFRLYQWKLN